MYYENVFSALAKYSPGNEENYLTEAFVFLINSLLEKERPIGLEILTQLCVENNQLAFDTDEAVSVSTQEVTEQGTPDIKVSSPNKLIYIEVKDYSPVDPNQLKRYKKDLESRSAAIRRLILLTRVPADSSEHQEIPDKHVRWLEVYNWLAEAKDKAQDPVSVYLIDSFKSFLKEKQMSIEKVGWEYINGAPSLYNLMKIIRFAIQGEALHISRQGFAREYMGFYFENGAFWCGISFDEPQVLLFEICRKAEFDTKSIAKAVESRYRTEENGSFFFKLKLEDIHFFSLDKDKQLEEITKFVKECHAQTQQMRIEKK